MFVCRPPSAAFRAGAMTSANRIGVSIGTAIWRGLRAVSAARRDASVRRARPGDVRRGAARSGVAAVGAAMVVAMGLVLPRGQAAAGRPSPVSCR